MQDTSCPESEGIFNHNFVMERELLTLDNLRGQSYQMSTHLSEVCILENFHSIFLFEKLV